MADKLFKQGGYTLQALIAVEDMLKRSMELMREAQSISLQAAAAQQLIAETLAEWRDLTPEEWSEIRKSACKSKSHC